MTPPESSEAFDLACMCKVGRILGGHDAGVPRWPLPALPERPAPQTMEQHRYEIVRRTLNQTGGNVLAAARILNINKTTIYDALKRGGEKIALKSKKIVRLAACVLVLCCGGAVTNAQPSLPKPGKGLNAPKVQAVAPRLRTNGVQWLRWQPGAAPQTLIISTQTVVVIPDQSYLARISGLATGSKQTYVVTNEFGESNIAIATVFAETNRIEEIGRLYRVPLYPGMTNWLVSSTNLVTWQPERVLTGNIADFIVTNNGPQKFYRLLAY